MIEIPALEGGEQNPETIVFLHGGGIGPWMWKPHMDALADTYHCLAPVLPGHLGGRPDLFDFETALQQVAELIRTRAHGSAAHVVGLSLGAQLATLAAARHPDLVNHLIVTGTNVTGLPALGLMGPLFKMTMPLRNLKSMEKATIKRHAIPAESIEEFRAESRASTAQGVTAIVVESGKFGVPEGLDRFVGPALVAFGAKEVGKVHKSAEQLRSRLADVTVARALSLNHTWPLEDPSLFVETVRAWLSDAPLPAGLEVLAGTAPITK